MATKVFINGKKQSRPGVYATIKSAVKNPSNQNTYGNLLIIDDGLGAGFGGGSGINGETVNGVNSIYEFTSLEDFQRFVKGGEIWNIAKPLFKPAGGQPGIAKLYYVRAATTLSAAITVALTNGGFVIETKDEGTNANGVLTSSELTRGYAGKFVESNGKYKFQIWHGTFNGTDAVNGVPYAGTLEADTKPELIIESPEFLAVSELIAWFTTNADFNAGFRLNAGSTATGNFVAGDLVTYPTYILASAGAETYNSTDFDAVLTKINDLNYNHILALKQGADAAGTNNLKLKTFVTGSSKYERIVVVAGGFDKNTRLSGAGSSVVTAQALNSERMVVVHGGVKKTSPRAIGGFFVYSQLYHAAAVVGRCLGLPPQVPVTLKSIDIDGLVDPLTDDEQEVLIGKGVMYSYFDTELDGVFVIGLGINSLQKNEYLINDDGTSYSWSLKRVTADLNKFIVFEGKKRFFDPNGLGGNRNTTSPEEVVVWAKEKLTSRTATDKRDDLIISFKEVTASLNQDNIMLDYKFVPNTEVKALFATGTIIEG